MEESTPGGREGAWGRTGLFIVERDVGTAGGVREDTVVIVIDFNCEGREGQPATRLVANKTTARASTSVDANGEQGAIERRNMVDSTKLDRVSLENEPDDTNASNRNAAAVSKGDS
jgi:hypothetical protein